MATKGPASLPDPVLARHPSKCPSCDYDVSGSFALGRCPECGIDLGSSMALFMAGVPRSEEASPGRKWAVIATIAAGLVFTQTLGLFIMFGYGWIPLVGLGMVLICTAWLVATGTRRARSLELLVFTGAGLSRRAWKSELRVGFMPWTRGESVHIKSVSSVWQKLAIHRTDAHGKVQRLFECGFRCPRDQIEWVQRTIESLVRGEQIQASSHAQPQ